MDAFQALFGSRELMDATEVLTSLMLAFLLSMIIATVYRWTQQSLNFSKTFLHSIVLACITSSIMIMVIGNNLARGLGILGALAIIRFRTPIRDPRDMVFLFCALAVGIGCGAGVFSVAIVGCLFFCCAAIYLHWSPFSSRKHFEGLLRFLLPPTSDSEVKLQQIFAKYTASTTLIAVRESSQGGLMEYSYSITLSEPTYEALLIEELSNIPGIKEPTILMHRSTVEI